MSDFVAAARDRYDWTLIGGTVMALIGWSHYALGWDGSAVMAVWLAAGWVKHLIYALLMITYPLDTQGSI